MLLFISIFILLNGLYSRETANKNDELYGSRCENYALSSWYSDPITRPDVISYRKW